MVAEKTPLEQEWIRRAKALLIRRNGCTELEAYAKLRELSMNGCTPLVEVARTVATTE